MSENIKAQVNPYDWQNPIVDARLFAGRRNELESIKQNLSGLISENPIRPVIAISGERRVGKTSVLIRVADLCQELKLLPIRISVESYMADDPWEFWHEIISNLMIKSREVGVVITGDKFSGFGFVGVAKQHADEKEYVVNPVDLWFSQSYMIHNSNPSFQIPTTYLIRHEIETLTQGLLQLNLKGIVIILDEAQTLVNSTHVKQQLRSIIQESTNIGLIFSGISDMTKMFTDPSEPFYGQATTITLNYFTNPNDIAECALLPLIKEQRELMSPMTVGYLGRLSQGKPNQIRLICKAIFDRYLRSSQKDLNITTDVLDDVAEILVTAYQDVQYKDVIDKISKLNSVYLEILYSLTRYSRWTIKDNVMLDESFRGTAMSEQAAARRERNLEKKCQYFIQQGILLVNDNTPLLLGGEFTHLYIRFLYEVRKYGNLVRRLVLGNGPETIFSEKTQKLALLLSRALGQPPKLQRFVLHSYTRDKGDIVGTVQRRFSLLTRLLDGEQVDTKEITNNLSDCLAVCELVRKAGEYYLLCLSIRNLENPRELMQIELYFDFNENHPVDLTALLQLVTEQCGATKIMIDGYGGVFVKVPDLPTFIKAIVGRSFEEFVLELNAIDNWRLTSVRRHINDDNKIVDNNNDDDDEENNSNVNWVHLYSDGKIKEADEELNRKLMNTSKRTLRAWYLNDRGYIRYGDKATAKLAKTDFENAIALHFNNLPLTLLNLSVIYIDNEDYEKAIDKIEDALLLTFSRIQFEVSYLRYRLPENDFGFKTKWEQHPANVLETAYINLAYAVLKSKTFDEAINILKEGLTLLPASVRLKHALARFYLSKRRADWAKPIYEELSSAKSLPDENIASEIKRMLGKRG